MNAPDRVTGNDEVSAILQARCHCKTLAVLADGRAIEIHNIAWGRDMGAMHDHITTNISPSPDEAHTLDFFHSNEVVVLEDMESGNILYARPDVPMNTAES